MTRYTQPTHSIDIIGEITSCFPQKFGIPRQPRIATAAQATIRLWGQYSDPQACEGLEGFSHIWVVFLFHRCIGTPWRAQVRPPRLGGNSKKGVFATRSPFRPNHLGLSVVRLESFKKIEKEFHLCVSGHDFLNGTPIVDIKPYLPYVDSIPEAKGGFAHSAVESLLHVEFSERAQCLLQELDKKYPNLRDLITQVIAQDPRPAYKNSYDKQYGLALYDLNIKWVAEGSIARVVDIAVDPSFESN